MAVLSVTKRMIVVVALVCVPVAAHAQPTKFPDFTLEELMRIPVEPVFGASKRLQPVTEAPASVTTKTE